MFPQRPHSPSTRDPLSRDRRLDLSIRRHWNAVNAQCSNPNVACKTKSLTLLVRIADPGKRPYSPCTVTTTPNNKSERHPCRSPVWFEKDSTFVRRVGTRVSVNDERCSQHRSQQYRWTMYLFPHAKRARRRIRTFPWTPTVHTLNILAACRWVAPLPS
jgi:hypothetical protein